MSKEYDINTDQLVEDYQTIMDSPALDTIDLIDAMLADPRMVEYKETRDITKLYADFGIKTIIDRKSFYALCMDAEKTPPQAIVEEHPFSLSVDVEDNYIEEVVFNTDWEKRNIQTIDEDVVLLFILFRNIVVEYTNKLERRDLFLPDFVFMFMAYELQFGDIDAVAERVSKLCDNDEMFISKLATELDTTEPTVIQYFHTCAEFYGE